MHPSLANGLVDAAFVDSLRMIKPLVTHNLIDKMKTELPYYLSACAGFSIDHSDVKDFTTKVLKWWADADKAKSPDVVAGCAHHLCVHAQLGGVGARLLPPEAHVWRQPDALAGRLHPGVAHAQVQQALGGLKREREREPCVCTGLPLTGWCVGSYVLAARQGVLGHRGSYWLIAYATIIWVLYVS